MEEAEQPGPTGERGLRGEEERRPVGARHAGCRPPRGDRAARSRTARVEWPRGGTTPRPRGPVDHARSPPRSAPGSSRTASRPWERPGSSRSAHRASRAHPTGGAPRAGRAGRAGWRSGGAGDADAAAPVQRLRVLRQVFDDQLFAFVGLQRFDLQGWPAAIARLLQRPARQGGEHETHVGRDHRRQPDEVGRSFTIVRAG